MLELINQAKAGDGEALYQANLGLIRRVALRYSGVCSLNRAVDLSDLMQAGYFALMEAAKTFDANNKTSWAGWAAFYLKREMRRALGLLSRNGQEHLFDISLDAPISAEDAQGDTMLDTLPDDTLVSAEDELIENELTQTVRRAVDRLPDREGEVIRRHELNGESLRQTGQALGITADTARGDLRRGCRKLAMDRDILRLKQAWWLDRETRFYAYKGAGAFRSDWTSTTEAAALWRMEHALNSGEG